MNYLKKLIKLEDKAPIWFENRKKDKNLVINKIDYFLEKQKRVYSKSNKMLPKK